MSITWTTFTETDLDRYINAVQGGLIRSLVLAEGQEDPFAESLADVVAMIRAAVASSPRNYELDADPATIPADLKWVCGFLVVPALQARIPDLALTDDQRENVRRADAYLRQIASGAIKIDPEQQSEKGGAAVEVASKTARKFTRDSLDGL